MAGFENEVLYATGERLQPSSTQAISIMQQFPNATNISRINHVGNPEGVVAANPSSLSHDPVSGNLYLKVSGQGTTLWKQITPTVSPSVLTLQGTTGGVIFPDVNGNFNILGGVNVAGFLPVSTAGTPNTITVNIQRSQAIAATDSTKVGLSVFNSAQFTVDANGFVSTSGTGVPNTLTGNTGGTISPVAGNINTVGTGSITIAGAGNTLTTQLTGLTNHAVLVGAGTSTITNVGPTATAGQILQSAGAAADPVFSTATYPSTTTVNQILYSSSTNVVSGLATANSSVLTTGATGVPVLTALTDGQIIIGSTAGAPAAASITSSDGSITITPGSNSISLTVTGGTTVGKTITGNTGGALSPTAGNWNILGASPAAGTSPVTTSGAASTLTVNVQKSQAIAATDATKVGLSNFNSSQFTVDANGFVSIASITPSPPNSTVNFVDDFLGFDRGIAVSPHAWMSQNIQLRDGSNFLLADAGHPGIAFNSGSGDSAYLAMTTYDEGGSPATSHGYCILIGGGAIAANWVFKLVSLGNYNLIVGLGDQGANNNGPLNGVYLRYSSGTNSGQWRLEAKNLNVATTVNTAVTVVAGWYNVGVTVNAAGTIAEYFVNGVSLGTINTNLPTKQIGGLIKLASGAADRILLVDLFYMTINLTTPR